MAGNKAGCVRGRCPVSGASVAVKGGRGLGGFEGKRTGRRCRPLAAVEIATKKVTTAPTCGRHSISWRPSRGKSEACWT